MVVSLRETSKYCMYLKSVVPSPLLDDDQDGAFEQGQGRSPQQVKEHPDLLRIEGRQVAEVSLRHSILTGCPAVLTNRYDQNDFFQSSISPAPMAQLTCSVSPGHLGTAAGVPLAFTHGPV